MTQPAAPPPSSPMQLPETWSSVANGYSEEVGPHAVKYAEEALRLVPLRATDHVIDIGAGPGAITFLAASRAARVTAVDFSPGMVDVVRARAARDGVQNLETAVMDAQALAFPDASFDAAFSMFVVIFTPDRARAFGEMLRVLRPGGRALVGTWSPIAKRPLLALGFEVMAEVLPQMPPMQKGDLQQPEECVAEMTAAGFRDVSARTFTAVTRIESAEHYLRMIGRSAVPLVALRKRLGEEAWTAMEAKLLEALRRRIPESGVELGAEAILTIGTR